MPYTIVKGWRHVLGFRMPRVQPVGGRARPIRYMIPMRATDRILSRLLTAGFQGLLHNKWQLEQIRGERCLLLLDDLIEDSRKIKRVMEHDAAKVLIPLVKRARGAEVMTQGWGRDGTWDIRCCLSSLGFAAWDDSIGVCNIGGVCRDTAAGRVVRRCPWIE